jgi:hypothetical protein
MIRRSTWILLGILALVVGVFFGLKKWPLKSSQSTATPTARPYLFTEEDGTLQIIEIKGQGKSFRMQRNTQNNWVITKPSSGEADQAQASEAETQVKALSILNTLETPQDLNAFQLATPAYAIDLIFTSGAARTVEVGAATPTGSGYYVRVDGGSIYVVSKYGMDALLNLLSNPPFPATVTPAVTDTPTPEIPVVATETATATP